MNQRKNPTWWNSEHESGWDRVKAAFKRDWDQTKHDMGGDEPDTDQDVDDTVKQATGTQPIPSRGEPTYEEHEDAYRFGYGARSQYQKQYPKWDDRLETQLKKDWGSTHNDREWADYSTSVRRGWDFDESQPLRRAA